LRIVYVTQYYPPEPAAAANRAKAFVDGLVERGHEVTVVCEQPNHPDGVFSPGYGRRPLVVEDVDGAEVQRVWVSTSPVKTTRTRLMFYGTFAAAAAARVATLRRADVVYASSPPLPGPSAVIEAVRLRRMPFVCDVRDIWPAAAVALGELSNPRLVRFFERVERHLYRHSAAVTTTTRAFCEHIDRVAGRPLSVLLPNGASDAMVGEPYERPRGDGEYVVGYVGNLGIAQGLDILPAAAEVLRDEPVRFLVVGGGPRGAHLREQIAARGLTNVEVRPPVPREDVSGVLRDCDALLVCLADEPVLEQFVPSKLFDAMAVGRPALLAARGEAAALVAQTRCGLTVEPEDGPGLAAAIRVLLADRARAIAMGEAGREAVGAYTRSRQVEKLDAVLQDAADGARAR
jgi:glycosyltransferase involved in cell wall biosynthesis